MWLHCCQMVKTDDNRYKHSDLVALQWGKEASVMPQMRKWADEATCVVIWNMWKYHKKRMRILWWVTRLTKVETLHSNSNWKQQYRYCICTVSVGWSVYMKRMCFIKSEVEGEIYAMKEKISTNKILASTSLVFGILSLFSFVLYFYSANHAPYTYIDVIFWGPLCSFIGIVISIITRKTRKIHPALWISGIISCMLGFILLFNCLGIIYWKFFPICHKNIPF